MILTVTLNPAVDHTIKLDGPLEADAVNRTTLDQYDAGGKGINVSKYLEALDAETVTSGLVGGLFGDFVERQLSRTKVPHDFVEMSGCTRLNTTILSEDGEYKINQSGHPVKRRSERAIIEKIADYDPETVVVAGSLPPGLGPATIDRIADAGDWDTAVDVEGGLLDRLEVPYAWCKPNRAELATATGMPTGTVEECRAAARELQSRGFRRVVASLGPDGAILVTDDDGFYVEPPETDVVDTAGAGDALLAGVLKASADGLPLGETLRYGVEVAGRVVEVPGTTVPSLSAVAEEASSNRLRSL
ncbi:1-phosphofructokinase family hexose kinase [Halorussus gelatinilyticus]|uniref:1-phosphofructokinase family hexose kinase n=1 Tax=Halorussus gelatinilyticus TaxID=2937524 RepID=A0A8U0IKB4_9EURY|nr:1-phosphofructokinase [Halorussus gelatinilyticus]UPW01198.1 1-phosphofructokinase family hexose kinase [Halorussus gelatinilyticus]